MESNVIKDLKNEIINDIISSNPEKFTDLKFVYACKWFISDKYIALTTEGYMELKTIKKEYRFNIPDSLLMKHRLGLSFSTIPYYLSNDRFSIFDENEAIVLTLLGRDVRLYAEHLLELNTNVNRH